MIVNEINLQSSYTFLWFYHRYCNCGWNETRLDHMDCMYEAFIVLHYYLFKALQHKTICCYKKCMLLEKTWILFKRSINEITQSKQFIFKNIWSPILGYNLKHKHVKYVTLHKNKPTSLKRKVFIEIINYNIFFLLYHVASTYFWQRHQALKII